MMANKKIFIILFILLFVISSAAGVFAEEIVVYSARGKALTKKPINSFSLQTGIKIKLVTGNIDELL